MKRKTVFIIILCAALIAATVVIVMLTNESTTGNNTVYTANKELAEGDAKSDAENSTKTAVCSFYPVYIAAKNIAKGVEGLNLTCLSQPQTGCLHDYQLTTDDVKLIESAGLLICNGGGMESFVNAAEYAKTYPGLRVLYASENLPVNELEEDNAHYWMDADLYEIYAQKVAIALSDFDTENAGIYMENYAAYREKIEETIALRDELSLEGKKVVNLSEPLSYLATDLGMEVSMFIDLEEEESISADTLAKACEILRSEDAVILYDEEGAEVANTLVTETGAKAVCLDVITTGDGNEDAWISGMTSNYNLLKEIQ